MNIKFVFRIIPIFVLKTTSRNTPTKYSNIERTINPNKNNMKILSVKFRRDKYIINAPNPYIGQNGPIKNPLLTIFL